MLAFTSRKLSMGSTSDFTALICRWVPSLIPAAASLLTSYSVERQLRMRKLMHWGNINAFRACHFLRWVLEDGDMVSRLWYLGLAPRHHTLSKKKKKHLHRTNQVLYNLQGCLLKHCTLPANMICPLPRIPVPYHGNVSNTGIPPIVAYYIVCNTYLYTPSNSPCTLSLHSPPLVPVSPLPYWFLPPLLNYRLPTQ